MLYSTECLKNPNINLLNALGVGSKSSCSTSFLGIIMLKDCSMFVAI